MKRAIKFLGCMVICFTIMVSNSGVVLAKNVKQEVYCKESNQEKHLEDFKDSDAKPKQQNFWGRFLFKGAKSSKPVLHYNARLSVDKAYYAGYTMTLTSKSTVKSTGKAKAITTIMNDARVIYKDGSKKVNTKTVSNASSCKISISSNDLTYNVSKYQGIHTFANSGYPTKVLKTSN